MQGLYISVGPNCFIQEDEILMVLNPKIASIKRMVDEAKEHGTNYIDCTSSKKLVSVVITKKGILVLSPIKSRTLLQRIDSKRKTLFKEQLELKKMVDQETEKSSEYPMEDDEAMEQEEEDYGYDDDMEVDERETSGE